MLSIFNRRDPIRTFSLKKQAEIQKVLAIRRIPYFTRMVNCRNLSFLSSGFWGAEELWMRIWLWSMNTPSSSKKTAMRRHWGSLAGFFSRWESGSAFRLFPDFSPSLRKEVCP